MNKHKKTSWVYTPKKINVWRGIGFGMNDLMGGGWNNIVSGVIFVFVMSNGISPALAGAITGIGRIFDALFSLFFGAITDGFYRNKSLGGGTSSSCLVGSCLPASSHCSGSSRLTGFTTWLSTWQLN